MKKLSVLIIEDSKDDVELLKSTLSALPYNISSTIVQTAETTRRALTSQAFDLVISDHKMPGYDAIEALEIFKSFQLDIPFIIYSNVIGEEAAVEAMRAGATDYVMKSNPLRLLPALERDLREASRRREKRALEVKLRLSEGLFEKVFNSPLIGLQFHDEHGTILEANDKFLDMLGYSRDELLAGKLTWRFITAPESYPIDEQILERLIIDEKCDTFRKVFIRKDSVKLQALVASAKVDHPVYKFVTYTIEDRSI